MTSTAPIINPPKTHNQSPYELIKQEVEDLYDEAKNWADGEPIATQEVHDEIEKLHELLHDAGKRAEVARVEEKKPFDDAVDEIQARFNELIGNTKTTGKGKVVLGKEALAALLLPWRKKVADEKAAVAAAAKEAADRIAAEAQAAMAASRDSGDLAAREAAELLTKEAGAVGRFAKQADKAATTGTGLLTRWEATLVDEGAALDHYYPLYREQFADLCREFARCELQTGVRTIPGFTVEEKRVVRV